LNLSAGSVECLTEKDVSFGLEKLPNLLSLELFLENKNIYAVELQSLLSAISKMTKLSSLILGLRRNKASSS